MLLKRFNMGCISGQSILYNNSLKLGMILAEFLKLITSLEFCENLFNAGRIYSGSMGSIISLIWVSEQISLIEKKIAKISGLLVISTVGIKP